MPHEHDDLTETLMILSLDQISTEKRPAPKQSTPGRLGLRFNGKGWGFFALMLKHIFLNIITLGIFLPWAKSEKRAYIWQNIEIGGQPLRYHGTGKELFKGYLKVIGAWMLYVGLISAASAFSPTLSVIVQIVLGIGVLSILPGIMLGARAYLLSRTSWRGVYFGFNEVKLFSDFTRLWIEGYIITIFSLGLYAPIWANELHTYLTNNTRFGNVSFEYRGETPVVVSMFFRALPLIILSGGLYYFWYRAKLLNYQLSETWFQGAKGESTLKGHQILWLFLVQVFGATFSLGLALPWITAYSFRVVLENLSFEGDIDFAAITQKEQSAGASADSFADAMEVGIAI